MAPKYTVKTRDLRVEFFEKSFRIRNHFPFVFLGREIPKNEAQTLANMMQGLVEKGKHPTDWEHYTRGLLGTVRDHLDEVAWQAQEIATLMDKVQDLEQELLNNAWSGKS